MTTLRRLVAIAGLAALSLTGTLAATAADAPSEARFLNLINQERTSRSLAPLTVYSDLVDDAQSHTDTMLSQNKLFHNPNLGSVTTGWYALGENVGYGYGVEGLHNAFMNSPGHRANILGDYNYVGIGVSNESDGTMWVTVVFMKGPSGLADAPPKDLDPTPSDNTIGFVNPRSGEWHLQDQNGTLTTFYYGNPGDYPVMGDWNCDGVDTPGLFRQSDGYVYLRNSNTQGIADVRFFFGNPGDVPLAGDFNGDGCDTISIYRPVNGTVYVINRLGSEDGGLGAAEFSYGFGRSIDVAFTGDFDNDGVDEVGLFHPDTGTVTFRSGHEANASTSNMTFGQWSDKVVAGDWNGDGNATVAAFRPGNRQIHLSSSDVDTLGTVSVSGTAADWYPVSGNFYLK